MDYRATLRLPTTSFPMRANAATREPEQLARWESAGLYEAMLEARRDAPLFVLHDGPPYANGNMHMGHVLNRVLKDIVVKFKHLAGHRTPYVPGWDCHGLPIELGVEKEIGRAKKAALSIVEVRELCDRYARRFVDIQRSEVRRLGVVGDWDNPYLTLDPAYEAQEIRELGRLASAGSLFRKKKPVYWCASCETALAEAEVEYETKRSRSIYVRFPLAEAARAGLRAALAEAGGDGAAPPADSADRLSHAPVAMVAWTTTPWTIPANLALSIHPSFEYVALRVGGGLHVVAAGLAEAYLTATGLVEEPGGRIPLRARALERLAFRHPWIERDAPVLLGDHVTLEGGTGVVHTAPGHGQEDYQIGLRYGLDPYAPVDKAGRFTAEVPDLQGMRVFEADDAVLDRIRAAGNLVAAGQLEHSYPHCWRCKKPLLFRATEQWFVSMETHDLRVKALEAIDGVEWIPSWGRDRIRGMIEARPDWCISRQRAWGVPIVALHCKGCGMASASEALSDHVAGIVEQEGASAWYARPLEDLVPAGFACPSCGGSDFERERDILDVWFDSGVSHAAVMEKRPGLRSPADLYLEGSDQHRGWFHTSLLTSVATRGRAPYRACLTHGFILDGQGRKMSKSLGNVDPPETILNGSGADVLRLWVAAEDYRGDVRMSKEILGHLVEAYRRMRNTARFLLANLGDFDLARDAVPPAQMPELERFALDRLARVIDRVREAYSAYEFHTVVHQLNNWCSVDLSALYLDVTKDRLYCSVPGDPGRRATQTVMFEMARALAGMAAPILSFLAEDVWAHLPGDSAGRPTSVFLSEFPQASSSWRDEELAAAFEQILAVRAAVTKALEGVRQAGQIGNALEARVVLSLPPALASVLEPRRDRLAELFLVSEVVLDGADLPESPLVPGLGVLVERAHGEKCARCWNWRDDVGRDTRYPGACGRCANVLARIGVEAAA